MKATQANFLEFLKKSNQFEIPIYQRTYSWAEPECKQLWDDLLRSGSREQTAAHFFGAMVYIEQGIAHVMAPEPLLVIDGQQRLTSIMLLLEALARELGDSEPVDGFSAIKIRNYYLQNLLEDGERRFKLLLTQQDKETLKNIVLQKEVSEDPSFRIVSNFLWFQEQLEAPNVIPFVCNGLRKLVIVDIALDRTQDNPQLIFESMNSTGLELSQADLIRNYLLMGLTIDEQTLLYQEHWRPMEKAFGQQAYGEQFDSFVRHYLTLKTGEIPKIRSVYQAFKQYAATVSAGEKPINDLVKELHDYAIYYCDIALDRLPANADNNDLKQSFKNLQELKVDVAFPMLLEVYADFRNQKISKDDLLRVISLVESYVFRRFVCSIPTNSMNKTFAGFMKSVNKELYVESIQAQFLRLPSYRRFPGDDEFKDQIQKRDMYNVSRRSYWLRRLENSDSKEQTNILELTIEHVMPQNPSLSRVWQEELGADWANVHQEWVHRIGNLTLTAYNSEYSDKSFQEKKNMPRGFNESSLRLNMDIRAVERWDQSAIQTRGVTLAKRALSVWPIPELPPDVLAKYQKPQTRDMAYSLADHKHLNENPALLKLFQALRKSILNLDSCVTEDILKLYIAYKAETNFVDVVPQANRLRLTLNLEFHEISDPKAITKDVTNLGRWGNGCVEFHVTGLEDLPYALGLIRQSLEKQLDVQPAL